MMVLQHISVRKFLHRLTGITQIVINKESSSPFTVLSSVPQGTVFILLLFLIFINNITPDLHYAIRLYSGDILICNSIYFQGDSEHLQQDLL